MAASVTFTFVEEDNENVIFLGYAEKFEGWKLRSRYFPCKVGGKPAWLNLQDLPELQCRVCGATCVFLLQVYAPFEDNEDCFHRTIFVFTCKNGSCCKKNSSESFLVFRCQLRRENKFYSFEPPEEDEKLVGPDASEYGKICRVCGNKGGKSCGKCLSVTYCSKDHQILDWKNGHRNQCGTEDENSPSEAMSKFLLPEFYIAMEDDVLPDKSPEKDESELEKELEECARIDKAAISSSDPILASEAEKYSDGKDDDKHYNKFKKITDEDPQVIIRYKRDGDPLWVTGEHIPQPSDIPPCSCGARRRFEFQIMPQLLIDLKVDSFEDSIDWGTLAVYTCSVNCSEGSAYHPEFIWKQDFSDSHTT